MMLKIIFSAVLLGPVIAGGLVWYTALQNRPEAVVKRFTQNLIEGDVDAAYERLTPELSQNRESYWREFLGQFKQSGEPALVNQERITDTFNTYADYQDPRRFVYDFEREDKSYRLSIIVIKQDRTWLIDELLLVPKN